MIRVDCDKIVDVKLICWLNISNNQLLIGGAQISCGYSRENLTEVESFCEGDSNECPELVFNQT